MDEHQMQAIMRSQVAVVVAQMTDDEVLAQRMAALLGSDPRQRDGYASLQPLYTEHDGKAMHAETRRAFLAISAARLGLG